MIEPDSRRPQQPGSAAGQERLQQALIDILGRPWQSIWIELLHLRWAMRMPQPTPDAGISKVSAALDTPCG